MFGIGVGMTQAQCTTWRNTYGHTFPTLSDYNSVVWGDYGDPEWTIPYNVILDTTMTVVYEHHGFASYMIGTYRSIIQENLPGYPTTTPTNTQPPTNTPVPTNTSPPTNTPEPATNTPTPAPDVPATGPVGLILILVALSGLLGGSALRRRK